MRRLFGLYTVCLLGLVLSGCTAQDEEDREPTPGEEPLVTLGPETGDDVVITGERRYTQVAAFTDVHGIGVDTGRPDLVYVATHNGLVRGSNDTVWERVGTLADDYMGFTIHPRTSGAFWVSGHPSRGGNMGVRWSDDGGFTWRTLALKGVDFHALTVAQGDPDRLYGSFQNKLHRSTDGGHHWTVPSDIPLPVSTLAVDPEDADIVYAVGATGAAVSYDAGQKWDALWERPTATFAIDPHRPERWFASFREGLHVSEDQGETWQSLPLGLRDDTVGYLAFDPTTAGTLYAATYKTAIHKTTDGGETWQVVKAGR